MRKLFFLSMLTSVALASVCLLPGCADDYKMLKEYENAMKQIKESYKTCALEIKYENFGVSYFKVIMKDNKWKEEKFTEGDNSYTEGVLYDGKELLKYSPGIPYAMINPVFDLDNDEYEVSSYMPESAEPLLLWYKPATVTLNTVKLKSFDTKKEIRNGFECRMIRYDNLEEICVSDEYGIAVYRKLKTVLGDIIYNLIKIDTSDIDDSEFQLPNGMKKLDYDSYMNELQKQM